MLNYMEINASKVAKCDIPDLMADIAKDLKGYALNIGAIAKAGEMGGIEPEQLYPIGDGLEVAYCAIADLADALDAIINGNNGDGQRA